MAVVRSARSSPPYALIIFVFLWLVSTGLAVLFYIQMGKAQADVQKNADDFSKTASSDDRRLAVNRLLEQANTHKAVGSKVTAIGEAVHQIDALHRKLNGGKGDSIEELTRQDGTIDQLIHGAGLSGNQTNLADAFAALNQDRNNQRDRANRDETSLASAKADYERATNDMQGRVNAYKKAIDEHDADIKALNEQVVKLHGEQDTLTKDHLQAINDLQAKNDKDTRALVTELQENKDSNIEKTKQIIDLQHTIQLLSQRPKVALGTEPDGKVLRASNLAGDVWINLGRKDHISPGMTFAVYDAHLGISMDQDAQGKKADIEVVDVGENDARARVTHVEANQQLSPGDLVASLVYDKNRKYHFYIYGDFDLDGDGIATAAERDRLIRLVESWGGIVDATFNSQTDFLVLGAEPGGAAQKFDAASDQTNDLIKQRTDQQKEYGTLQTQAHDFAIPVLNANRFLSMIGYYNPVIAR